MFRGCFVLIALSVIVAELLCGSWAEAHELWVEVPAQGELNSPQTVLFCWGHGGHRETGEMLLKHEQKLSAWLLEPGGRRQPLELSRGSDSFRAGFTPEVAGDYRVDARIEVGILTKEVHGFAPKTRIVMLGAACLRAAREVHVKQAQSSPAPGLQIVGVSDLAEVHVGDLVTAQIQLDAKPIGGGDVVVTLGTCGPVSPANPQAVAEWTIEENADPRSGKVTFPIIAPGLHTFLVRYTDPRPGVYEGDLQFETEYSRLGRGDTYDRTLYVSTLTFSVKQKSD